MLERYRRDTARARETPAAILDRTVATNDLTFLVEFEDPDREYRPWIVPVIDGIDLRSSVQRAITTEAHPLFGGLPLSWFSSVRGHYLASRSAAFEDGRLALLGCSCAIVDCDPIYARIRVDDTHVTWTDLVRHGSILPLGPFRFERGAYELAVQQAMNDAAALCEREAAARA